jgi:hypothetical protein
MRPLAGRAPAAAHMSDLAPLQQLLQNATPALALLLCGRLVLAACVRLLLALPFLRPLRPLRRLRQAGARACGLVAAAALAGCLCCGAGLGRELSTCLPARSPRPHALSALSALATAAGTARARPCAAALGSLVMAGRASPLAFLLSGLALTEWRDADGALNAAVAAASVAAAVAHLVRCAPTDPAADALLFAVAAVFWSRLVAVRAWRFLSDFLRELKDELRR